MSDLKNLHDATLEKIEFFWKEGKILIDFRSGLTKNPLIRLIATNVSNFICPRQYPWGPSVSVNKITKEQEAQNVKLVVEMQSGDVFEIKCEAFILEAS